MPTGQALAERLGLPALTADELEAAAASTRQAKVLRDTGFLQRTPLWYYLLAEARHHAGQRLGPVGGTLVAEVLVGLVRRSEDSILRSPGWVPSLPAAKPGRFDLADLLRFAKVVGGGAAPRTYKVKKGDTLSGIAQKQLGKADRWPEIFVLNRAKIRHRDRLTPGQVLTLPGATPVKPRPELYKVKKGDTLSGIAGKKLGDAGRWPEIARLNRDIVPDPDELFPGQVLVILKR
jgi:nucleoid-associated protein YgaU